MELFKEYLPKTDSVKPADIPLAERMRPTSIDQFVGQEHLLAPGKALQRLIESHLPCSMIFWGPPGSGKTTLARIIAKNTHADFMEYSAVLSGIKEIKEVIKQADSLLKRENKPTILFVDEIHRFNKAQQDAFLPYVETGAVILIGATTENPSFEVIAALLSRTRVFTLEPLSETHLMKILQRTLSDKEHGLGGLDIQIGDETLTFLCSSVNGDARVALSALELAINLTRPDEHGTRRVDRELVAQAMQRRTSSCYKNGEEHYNYISAFHKSLRGSDPDAALYWLARMLDSGEDPLYIARRMVRFASEDIGIADSKALQVALAARDAYHYLGSPEGDLALAHGAVYLATAPKSNRVDRAFIKAKQIAHETPHLQIPLHIRNAPTNLMKSLGYGTGYQYDHDSPDAYSGQDFLPDELKGITFYEPSGRGFESEIARRLAWWKNRKADIKKEETLS